MDLDNNGNVLPKTQQGICFLLSFVLVVGCTTNTKENALPLWGNLVSIDARNCGTGSSLRLSDRDQHATNIVPYLTRNVRELDLSGTALETLDEVRGSELSVLVCSQPVCDISGVRGLATLRELSLFDCSAIDDFTALRGLTLSALDVGMTRIRDLSVITNMPLVRLGIATPTITNMECITMITTLREVEFLPYTNSAPLLRSMSNISTIHKRPAPEFWRLYDSGAFDGTIKRHFRPDSFKCYTETPLGTSLR